MASTLDEKSLKEAFSTRPDIQGAIRNAAAGKLQLCLACLNSRLYLFSYWDMQIRA